MPPARSEEGRAQADAALDSLDSLDSLLTLEDVRAGYTQPVVGPVSLTIANGEILGLWGANGSGKSTLLKAIANAAALFSGRITRAPDLRIAYQEQQPARLALMPLTGRDLLRAAAAADPAAPLQRFLRLRLDRLSGGQFQLLMVWATLAGDANLVLLDEPTNNLDPAAEQLLAELLHSHQDRNRGVLLVSHERGFLERVCTRRLDLS